MAIASPRVDRKLQLKEVLDWLVQDGVVDTLGLYRADRPGPLPAIHQFLAGHPEFQIDRERVERLLVTHHPDGWLRRL